LADLNRLSLRHRVLYITLRVFVSL